MKNPYEKYFPKNDAAIVQLKGAIWGATVDRIESLGITQKQAAEMIGVTQPRISNYMQGKLSLFSVEMMLQMAMSLGLSVSTSRDIDDKTICSIGHLG